ncbi:MAG: hypothetical protein [Microviridae sp.]|nr:MAG: hypothetical protein [Microviridae sp.]
MKKLYVCQIIDHVSETVVSTFTVPTHKYFDRQMEAFFKDCEKKGIPVVDFEGFVIACVNVCETFVDAVSVLDGKDVYRYSGSTYIDLDKAGEVE